MDIHFAQTIYDENLAFTAYINSHPVKMDSDNNVGPSPKRLMLASLAGCTGVDVVTILNKMKVEFSDFSVETEAAVADTIPKIYNKVKIIYKIKLALQDQAKMKKAVDLSQEKYCSVTAMFKSFAKLETEIIFL